MLMSSAANPQTIRWLWKPYLQRGAINLLTGDPGIGKTSLVCEIAACLSRGESPPNKDADGPPPGPQNVWILNAEDGIEDTIIWRLMNQKAALDHIWLTGAGVHIDDDAVREIEEKVRSHNIALLVLDPIQAWIGKDTDMHRANETRAWASGLRDMAVRTGCAVLLVRHRRKGAPGDQHLYTGLGSIDISGFARSEISVLKRDEGICVLTRTKGNVGKTGLKLCYSLESHPDPLNDHAILTWRGEIDPEAGPQRISKVPKKLNAARDWIKRRLANGPERVVTCLTEGVHAGFTDGTLKKAREMVADTYQVPTETGAMWYWRLKDGAALDDGGGDTPEHEIVGAIDD